MAEPTDAIESMPPIDETQLGEDYIQVRLTTEILILMRKQTLDDDHFDFENTREWAIVIVELLKDTWGYILKHRQIVRDHVALEGLDKLIHEAIEASLDALERHLRVKEEEAHSSQESPPQDTSSPTAPSSSDSNHDIRPHDPIEALRELLQRQRAERENGADISSDTFPQANIDGQIRFNERLLEHLLERKEAEASYSRNVPASSSSNLPANHDIRSRDPIEVPQEVMQQQRPEREKSADISSDTFPQANIDGQIRLSKALLLHLLNGKEAEASSSRDVPASSKENQTPAAGLGASSGRWKGKGKGA